MLWPLVLPFKITFWVLTVAVIAVTALVPSKKWKRSRMFVMSLGTAIVVSVPIFFGVTYVVDEFRFGDFAFETFNDIDDFRAERYLPPNATDIRMQKHANGYRARYLISEADFHTYLEHLWDECGQSSSVQREELAGAKTPASSEVLQRGFSDLGWKPLKNAIQHDSPLEPDGGGATWYFDSEAGVAYQRTCYW